MAFGFQCNINAKNGVPSLYSAPSSKNFLLCCYQILSWRQHSSVDRVTG